MRQLLEFIVCCSADLRRKQPWLPSMHCRYESYCSFLLTLSRCFARGFHVSCCPLKFEVYCLNAYIHSINMLYFISINQFNQSPHVLLLQFHLLRKKKEIAHGVFRSLVLRTQAAFPFLQGFPSPLEGMRFRSFQVTFLFTEHKVYQESKIHMEDVK